VKPGDVVRTREPLMGFEQGPSTEHGDGAPREIPADGLCEVFSIDRTTGWITVHFDLDGSGPREPYRVEAITEREMLTAARRPELPPMIPEGTPEHL
jgi:hypothetical protein